MMIVGAILTRAQALRRVVAVCQFIFSSRSYCMISVHRQLQVAASGPSPSCLDSTNLPRPSHSVPLLTMCAFNTLTLTLTMQGRWMLPVLFGHWLLTLLASILGLAAREHGAPVYEYEPLRSEGAV